MSKKLLLVLFVLALVAMPAFASVQNVKVSGNLDTTYVNRQGFDLGTTLTPAAPYSQSLFITQTELKVEADLTDNVSTVVSLINERPWDQASSSDTKVDINKAYVQLREMLYSPLTVTIGRSDLHYGNGLIVGKGGPNNAAGANSPLASVAGDLSKQTIYDNIKVVLDYNPLTIDMFAAKIDANNLHGLGTSTGGHKDDVDLYGTNLNYNLGDEMDTIVEGYFFAKIDQSLQRAASPSVNGKQDSVYTPGLRVSTNPLKGLNLQAEAAWQTGTKVTATNAAGNNLKREANAQQLMASYQIQQEKVAKYNPMISSVYTHVSGDQNPTDASYASESSRNKWTAWDPMFENQAGGTIYNSLFNLTNVNVMTFSGQMAPMQDVTAKLSWTSLWMDKELECSSATCSSATLLNLVQPDGVTTVNPRVNSNKGLGYEIDAGLNYAYTEDVNIGLNYGFFRPGEVFDSSNDKVAQQTLATVGVAF